MAWAWIPVHLKYLRQSIGLGCGRGMVEIGLLIPLPMPQFFLNTPPLSDEMHRTRAIVTMMAKMPHQVHTLDYTLNPGLEVGALGGALVRRHGLISFHTHPRNQKRAKDKKNKLNCTQLHRSFVSSEVPAQSMWIKAGRLWHSLWHSSWHNKCGR